tara:strand:+ start:145 stop:1071 length:927 start_codon:yes stop_codon:yes gene_type:complete
MKNLLSISDIEQKTLSKIIDRVVLFSSKGNFNTLKNKKIALLFSEVSLRTKISFEIATQLLGGIAVSISIPHLTKEFDGTPREDFLDILKSLEGWVDGFVVREYSGKYLEKTLKNSKLPVIDAFCGKNHPSQTIGDLSIIKKKFGELKGIKVCCICPPFGSGIMESFAYGCIIMGMDVRFLSPKGEYKPKNKDFLNKIKKLQEKYKGNFRILENKKDALRNAKILYVDEWWKNSPEFLKIQMNGFKVDDKFLELVPDETKIMHYLPAHHDREISKEILHSNKSIAFEQAEFRLYSAMASLEFIFGLIK